VSQDRTLTPNFTAVTLKMWAFKPPKSLKLLIFGINLPKKGIPLEAIFIKISVAEGSQVRTLTPNFIVVTFKMWAYSPKIAKIGNFGYKFAKKWYTPLSDFYKIWVVGESPCFALSCQISPL